MVSIIFFCYSPSPQRTLTTISLPLLLLLLLLLPLTQIFSSIALLAVSATATDECTANNYLSSQHYHLQHPTTNEEYCWNATSFAQLVSSFFVANNNERNTSVLPQLRGSIDNLLSPDELTSLLELLPSTAFIEAAGYTTTTDRDIGARQQVYTAPIGYAAIGLQELSSMGAAATDTIYKKILQIRELVRKTTEQSLHLCPGTLYIDYTTISHKTEGGSHRPHADNCYHYFDDKQDNLATCHTASITSTMKHPHPQRVAASILYLNDDFDGGEFYFANQHYGGSEDGDVNGLVDTIVPVQPGRMIYFTSGVENLHGALPVRKRKRKEEQQQHTDEDEPTTRRLALAMWYVTDPELEEFVPPFRDGIDDSSLGEGKTKSGPQTLQDAVTDTKDPNAPEQLFSIRIPSNNRNIVSSLVNNLGIFLTSKQNTHHSLWKVNRYGENDDTLHVLFKDHSAMFSLNLRQEDDLAVEVEVDAAHATTYHLVLVVDRHTDGRKRPSLQYMLQESVILHGLLDAISTLMSDLILNENETWKFMEDVEKARKTLPARRA